MAKYQMSVAHHRHRRMKFMGTARQRPQLVMCGATIMRLTETLFPKSKRLISTHNGPSGPQYGARFSLFAGQQDRDFTGAGRREARLNSTLIDVGRGKLDCNSSRFKHRPPCRAARGEDH